MVKLLNVISRDIIKPMKAALPAATAVCCCTQLLWTLIDDPWAISTACRGQGVYGLLSQHADWSP